MIPYDRQTQSSMTIQHNHVYFEPLNIIELGKKQKQKLVSSFTKPPPSLAALFGLPLVERGRRCLQILLLVIPNHLFQVFWIVVRCRLSSLGFDASR